MNIVLQALGAALFARAGATTAPTVGLLSGNRGIGLVWAAAAGEQLAPGTAFALLMGTFPIFILPALFRALIPDPSRPFAGYGWVARLRQACSQGHAVTDPSSDAGRAACNRVRAG